jgi:hypothetical protein
MPPPPADAALSACNGRGRLSSLLQQLHVSAPARALTAQGPRCERHDTTPPPGVALAWPRGRIANDVNQGLTLVHLSAQLERFVWDRGCA